MFTEPISYLLQYSTSLVAVADQLALKFTPTYVGMVVEYCGHVMELVHITVCMALLVFVLCQPVHSCIVPSIHGLDFFLVFFMETCVC